MPVPGDNVRHLPFLSVPTWDISDEEIEEWKQDNGHRLVALVAERIRDGFYKSDEEIFPPESCQRHGADEPRYFFGKDAHMLIERGMVRESDGRWYAITPGRMEPSIRRAMNVLIDCRADLPDSLAVELDSWKATLDELASSGGIPDNRSRRTARQSHGPGNSEKKSA